MKLDNISVGLRVANYRKLCELLGEKVTSGGNAKQAQLKRWEQYFGFRREKNAFIITEIYAVPKQPVDKRMKYAQYLKPILLNHLACFGGRELTFEKWYVALEMISESYVNEKKIDEIQRFYGLQNLEMQKLIYMVKAVSQRALLSTLTILKNEQYITFAVNEYIVFPGGGRRLATKEEQREIQKCKDEAMNAVGAASMFVVNINAKKKKLFYEKLHSLYEQNYGWDRTYDLLEITPVQEGVAPYGEIDIGQLIEELKASIKRSVKTALNSELDRADKNILDEWENDMVTDKYRVDAMTVGVLTHILMEEM